MSTMKKYARFWLRRDQRSVAAMDRLTDDLFGASFGFVPEEGAKPDQAVDTGKQLHAYDKENDQ